MVYKNISNTDFQGEISGESSICKWVESRKGVEDVEIISVGTRKHLYCCDSDNNCYGYGYDDEFKCSSPNQTSACYNYDNLAGISDVSNVDAPCYKMVNQSSNPVCGDENFQKNSSYLFCVSVGSTQSFYPTFQKALEWIVSRDTKEEMGNVTAYYVNGNYYLPNFGDSNDFSASLICGDFFSTKYNCLWKGLSGRTDNQLCFERSPRGEMCVIGSKPFDEKNSTSSPKPCITNIVSNSTCDNSSEVGLGVGLGVTGFLTIITLGWALCLRRRLIGRWFC